MQLLGDAPVASIASQVLEAIFQEQHSTLDEAEFNTQWQSIWQPQIVQILVSDDEDVRQRLVHSLLPTVFRTHLPALGQVQHALSQQSLRASLLLLRIKQNTKGNKLKESETDLDLIKVSGMVFIYLL